LDFRATVEKWPWSQNARIIQRFGRFATEKVFRYENRKVLADVLHCDGGMTENDLLMQFQSDMLNKPVVRLIMKETTALGAAYAIVACVGTCCAARL